MTMNSPIPLDSLMREGLLTADTAERAEAEAQTLGLSLEKVLLENCGVPEAELRRVLSERWNTEALEYDERLSVPGDLLERFHELGDRKRSWLPMGRRQDGTVVIATPDPGDEDTRREAAEAFGPDCLFLPALERDVLRFIQDFGTRDNGRIVGAERTDLAFWRNTMALWRTMLACYRTDMAKCRTGLNILRWGLGFVALCNGLLRHASPDRPAWIYGTGIALGVGVVIWGFCHYWSVRRLHLRPPRVQTLVEVSAVILSFLEDFHFVRRPAPDTPEKTTMLGRLGDFLSVHSTVLAPFPAHRPRIHLARERNVLAAQRTIGACYRTIAARARTGLSFLRTGVSLTCLGLGFVQYFGLSAMTVFDALLVLAGLGMIVDGVWWYLPVRGEYSETPRCNAEV